MFYCNCLSGFKGPSCQQGNTNQQVHQPDLSFFFFNSTCVILHFFYYKQRQSWRTELFLMVWKERMKRGDVDYRGEAKRGIIWKVVCLQRLSQTIIASTQLLHSCCLHQNVLIPSFFYQSDIDECSEGIHGCHGDATCVNTKGLYRCECSTGYHGDGKNCKGERQTWCRPCFPEKFCKPAAYLDPAVSTWYSLREPMHIQTTARQKGQTRAFWWSSPFSGERLL